MSEAQQKTEAFLSDLIAVCRKHGMAIMNQDEYGIALKQWGGWEDTRKVNPVIIRGPQMTLYHITPDGAVGEHGPDFLPRWEEDGAL